MEFVLIVAGSVFYPIINVLTRKILSKFNGLSLADIYHITEKCVCSIQAIISTVIGWIIIENCGENIMTDSHYLTILYAWFGLPYFVYDTWAMYKTYFYENEAEMRALNKYQQTRMFARHRIDMLIHHVALPAIYFPAIVYFRKGLGDYFVGIFYCCEATIPFISIRFILAQLKLKDTTVYIFFGLLMIVVFFITRILVFPFLYWKYGQFARIDLIRVPFTIPIKCNIGCAIIFAVQAYFMVLMVRGAFKVFYKMYHLRKKKRVKENVD